MLLMLKSTNDSTDAFFIFVLSICKPREQYLTLAINYIPSKLHMLSEEDMCGEGHTGVANPLGHTEQNALAGISRNGPGEGIHHSILRRETRAICLKVQQSLDEFAWEHGIHMDYTHYNIDIRGGLTHHELLPEGCLTQELRER